MIVFLYYEMRIIETHHSNKLNSLLWLNLIAENFHEKNKFRPEISNKMEMMGTIVLVCLILSWEFSWIFCLVDQKMKEIRMILALVKFLFS